METVTDQHVETESPPRGRRYARLIALAAGIVVAVLGASLVTLLAVRSGGILPGVTAAGIDLGGLSSAEARQVIAGYERDRAAEAVTVTFGDETLEDTAGSLGYRVDVDATVDEAVGRGRQSNPVAALRDHLRAFRASTPVPVSEDVDASLLGAWALSAAERLSFEPVEGTITFEGASVQRTDPATGEQILLEPLRTALHTAVLAPGDQTVEAQSETVEPRTTSADVDAIYAPAQRAVSGPVTLARNDGSVTFPPEDIAGTLRVARTGGNPALDLRIDEAAVGALVPDDAVEGFNTDPVEAEITISGGNVNISESSNGFRYDRAAAAEQLLAVATGDGDREVTLEGETVEPEMSTADAEALEIVEPIGSFTTEHACCQGRVQNIQRMADIIDGVLIKPGETFSVNEYVGPRTREKGFTDGGVIIRGEFEEAVGGGVSQFATTMYNAAYFAGYEISEFQPHSYYISRYPAGREATLNYNTIDLKVHNNSPYGAIVKTSYTPTSITVTFWGKEWVEVESVSGPTHNIRPGNVRNGFDIVVTRILRFPDGSEEREEHFTRYNPENT